ncbi:MAG: Tfp pilus assembly protein PilZ [Lysobacterales bacterium]|jgi:Tfp pilus assembly protein PilZ
MSLANTTESERRIWNRFPARFPARIKDSRESFGANFVLQDASATGVSLTSRERFYVNDSVVFEVQLPDGLDPMVIRGEIVWVKPTKDELWNIGIQFHKTNLIHSSRLYKFIDSSE